jgi:predicted phosphodiesterase
MTDGSSLGGESYSEEEIKDLIRWYINEDLTLREVVKLTNEKHWSGKKVRTEKALECKLLKMNIRKRGFKVDIGETTTEYGKIADLKDKMSYTKVADTLGKPIGTVKSIINRIKNGVVSTNLDEADVMNKLKEKLVYYFKNCVKDEMVDIVELSNKFNVSPSKIEEAIELLQKDSINFEYRHGSIELSRTIPVHEPMIIDSTKFFNSDGRIIKFGAIGDNHLCSKYAREDILNTLYDVYENEGITKVFLAGNMIDGERNFNKYDIHTRGVEGQVGYFVKNFPQRKGIETHFITGDDHEGWYVQDVHLNIGDKIQHESEKAGRNDLKYIGHMERDIVFKGGKFDQTVRVIHAGGGSSYAVSYTSQKYAEVLQGGEKPRVILVGHFHKFAFDYVREIYMVQVGSTQDQTPFMRKKRLQSHLGGCIVELHQDSNGIINRCKVEFISFFDKKFYEYHW